MPGLTIAGCRLRKQWMLADAQMHQKDGPWRLLISFRDNRQQGPVSGAVSQEQH
jgi:hypothetical protein